MAYHEFVIALGSYIYNIAILYETLREPTTMVVPLVSNPLHTRNLVSGGAYTCMGGFVYLHTSIFRNTPRRQG
jgi:hypothetical protein